MKVLGIGNTGARLALMFDNNALLFSTAEQDTNNIIEGNKVYIFSKEGASKRFRNGIKIWEENEEKLKEALINIKNEKVILFSSLGGGSGSSSLKPISSILIENNCKVLIIGILPFIKENNPPLANAVQSINNILPLINDISIMIFDNNNLIKMYEGDWIEINDHIIRQVDYIVNLLRKYNTDAYSPMTLDQSELDSVIFGGGFLDISDTFIEEKTPKFEYGSLSRDTKNFMICMFVDEKIKLREEVNEYQKILTNTINKYSGRVPNARMIPGILRAKVNRSNAEEEVDDRCYLTIASGLSIEKYLKKIEKLRDKAIEKAEAFSERVKAAKVIDRKESKILDI